MLTWSGLYRCLERHGISRLPVNESMAKRRCFAETTIVYVHVDGCAETTAIYMFLAIERT